MKPYYYIFKSSGYPPSKRHETLESAEQEAKRLATLHAGQSFEILQCVAVVSTTVPSPTTYWMDKPNAKYRQLEDGERLQDGDEFYSQDRVWVKTTQSGAMVNSYGHKLYRRPL